MKFFSAILIFSVVAYVESLDCRGADKEHTLCRFKGPSKVNCKRVFQRGLESQNPAMGYTNSMRARVANGKTDKQPPAADMCELTWDDESAEIAQRWADQCQFGHDGSGLQRKTSKYENCGQNVFIQEDPVNNCTEDWRAAIKTFYDEHKLFDKSGVNSYVHSADYGHYTQLVWGSTSVVGCGFTCYEGTTNKDKPFKRLYVCNYCDTGNKVGKPLYQQGTAASKCKNGASRHGLCKC